MPARPAGGLAARLAALGPYFAVDIHEPGSSAHAPWLPLAALTGEPGEWQAGPAALTSWIGQVRGGLAAAAGCPASQVEFRVAASVAQLGVAARLMSPALGAEVLGGTLLLDPSQARWVPALGGPFPLSLPATALGSTLPAPGTTRAPRNIEAGITDLLAGPVSDLVRAVAALSVSPLILWGNVASAINGAAAMIAASRPDLARQAAETADAALEFPALVGAFDGHAAAGFRRRSCCLIYRLGTGPGAGLCGDCVLGPG